MDRNPTTNTRNHPQPQEDVLWWITKLGGAGTGVLFISPDRKQLKYILQILWQATNNETEYEALIHELRVAITLVIKWLLVYGDSAVVVNQVNKD
jgi:ribonuclease HI